jgi:hypothetical protein
MTKPALVKKMAIATTPRVRLRKDFGFGPSIAIVASKVLVVVIALPRGRKYRQIVALLWC